MRPLLYNHWSIHHDVTGRQKAISGVIRPVVHLMDYLKSHSYRLGTIQSTLYSIVDHSK
jgi:hypothetical protein